MVLEDIINDRFGSDRTDLTKEEARNSAADTLKNMQFNRENDDEPMDLEDLSPKKCQTKSHMISHNF